MNTTDFINRPGTYDLDTLANSSSIDVAQESINGANQRDVTGGQLVVTGATPAPEVSVAISMAMLLLAGGALYLYSRRRTV